MCRKFRCVLRMVHGASEAHNESRTSAGVQHSQLTNSPWSPARERQAHRSLCRPRGLSPYRATLPRLPLHLRGVMRASSKTSSGFVLVISPSPDHAFRALWPLWGTRVGHNASSRTVSKTKALLSRSSVSPKLCKQLCITRDNGCKSDLRDMARAVCGGRYARRREKQMKVW